MLDYSGKFQLFPWLSTKFQKKPNQTCCEMNWVTLNTNFLISKPTLWCDHSFESSQRDDSNDSHTKVFGEGIKKCL